MRNGTLGQAMGWSTMLLSRDDVHALLSPDVCIHAVEDAFRKLAMGSAPAPAILGLHAEDGGFHVKAGGR